MHRRFVLERERDVSGVSGTGMVAEGVSFSDGRVALHWVANGEHQSTVVWDSIESVKAIHGHHGATKVRWIDDQQSNGFVRESSTGSWLDAETDRPRRNANDDDYDPED